MEKKKSFSHFVHQHISSKVSLPIMSANIDRRMNNPQTTIQLLRPLISFPTFSEYQTESPKVGIQLFWTTWNSKISGFCSSEIGNYSVRHLLKPQVPTTEKKIETWGPSLHFRVSLPTDRIFRNLKAQKHVGRHFLTSLDSSIDEFLRFFFLCNAWSGTVL